jgi:hypothetical protein
MGGETFAGEDFNLQLIVGTLVRFSIYHFSVLLFCLSQCTASRRTGCPEFPLTLPGPTTCERHTTRGNAGLAQSVSDNPLIDSGLTFRITSYGFPFL